MVGFPNKPMGVPTKNDHLGCEMGVPTIWGNTCLVASRAQEIDKAWHQN